ncbi:multifunctional transcriptional regulator/nicotinamide-nucleotide adenylyltransferase/ribosylnicotinamide kinase NadR [Wukongibacter baidiensis]
MDIFLTIGEVTFMYKIGVFPGKFLPPHRGQLNAIINASTRCEKLYVVVSDNANVTKRLCEQSGIKVMDLKTRAKWLSIELQNFDHIQVVMLDETGIPEQPRGWDAWAELLIETVPEKFDVVFGGEPKYQEPLGINLPGVAYELFDYKRERYPISGTAIRDNALKHWDYILGSVRPHFAKKVLITGTESCGKTTVTKYLAKIFHTSWVEEVGRYYSERYLGGNEDVYTLEDFEKIVQLHMEEEDKSIRTANKIVFIDTDATVTQYYCEMFLHEKSEKIDSLIDPDRYDIVLMFAPDVKWVDDGLRWLSGDDRRWQLHNKLKDMYIERGFGDKIIEISGDYNERLNKAIEIIDKMLNV